MSTTPKTAPTQEEIAQAVEFLSTKWGQGRDTTRFTVSVDVVLAALAAKERECERLKSALAPFCVSGGDNTLEAFADLESCGVVGLGLVAGDFRAARAACGPVSAMHYRRDYCPDGCNREDFARAEKAEARCEALEAACRRQVANIEHWLETGEPAGREESKSIYEQLKAALRAGKE